MENNCPLCDKKYNVHVIEGYCFIKMDESIITVQHSNTEVYQFSFPVRNCPLCGKVVGCPEVRIGDTGQFELYRSDKKC